MPESQPPWECTRVRTTLRPTNIFAISQPALIFEVKNVIVVYNLRVLLISIFVIWRNIAP
jgi:hypothetical protein